MLGEGDTFVINENFGAPEKKFSINFSKANFSISKTKFFLSLHCNGDNSYLFVNRKKSVRLKQIIKMSTFQINFVWESYLINVEAEVSLEGNVYHFSVDNDAIRKSDILNIHKYLMVKNDIK